MDECMKNPNFQMCVLTILFRWKQWQEDQKVFETAMAAQERALDVS